MEVPHRNWRVALVSPNRSSTEKQIPLGPGYLASYLLANQRDLSVSVLDTGVDSDQEAAAFLPGPWDLVGVSVTSRQFREGLELARAVKAANPSTPVVFGGAHVSLLPEAVLGEPVIDYAVHGEGEVTLHELVSCLRAGGGEDPARLERIAGLAFRQGGTVRVNAPREFIADLDALPFPAFHLFKVDRYPCEIPIVTSRGCPYRCAYCASTNIWGRRWRGRSAENIVDEIEAHVRAHGERPVSFHDDGFNISLKRVNEICARYRERGIRAPFLVRGFRADIIDPPTAERMRAAGCAGVAIGIESANNAMLKAMGKNETIEQIDRGVTTLRDAGIDVLGMFMIGNPGETLETVRESLAYIRRSRLSRAVMGTAVPFPRTRLWEYVEEHGKFLVEPDCTTFERISPRIIFETPEFPREDRLRAIELARAEGVLGDGSGGEGARFHVSDFLKRKIRALLFGCLPAGAATRLYFALRSANVRARGLAGSRKRYR